MTETGQSRKLSHSLLLFFTVIGRNKYVVDLGPLQFAEYYSSNVSLRSPRCRNRSKQYGRLQASVAAGVPTAVVRSDRLGNDSNIYTAQSGRVDVYAAGNRTVTDTAEACRRRAPSGRDHDLPVGRPRAALAQRRSRSTAVEPRRSSPA